MENNRAAQFWINIVFQIKDLDSDKMLIVAVYYKNYFLKNALNE